MLRTIPFFYYVSSFLSSPLPSPYYDVDILRPLLSASLPLGYNYRPGNTTYIHTRQIHTQCTQSHPHLLFSCLYVHLSCVLSPCVRTTKSFHNLDYVWMCLSPNFVNVATWMVCSCISHHFDCSAPFQNRRGSSILTEAFSSSRNSLMCFASPFLLEPFPYQCACILRGIVRVIDCSGGGQIVMGITQRQGKSSECVCCCEYPTCDVLRTQLEGN